MDKNSLILDIKNDLNSIKKQIDVALAKLAVLESMVELDNKLGVNNGELVVRNFAVSESNVQFTETLPNESKIAGGSEELGVKETKPEPVVEPEPIKESELEQEIDEAKEFRNLMSIIGLNDRFRFRHDLFSDDNDLFRETIEILNTLEDFEKAVDFLDKKFNWDPEDATVVYFYDIIKPKF